MDNCPKRFLQEEDKSHIFTVLGDYSLAVVYYPNYSKEPYHLLFSTYWNEEGTIKNGTLS